MRKTLLLSFLLLWSVQVFSAAVTTVRLNPDIDLTVTGTTTTTFTIGSAEPSGDATAESAPARVYVPMDGPLTGPGDEVKYFAEKEVSALLDATNTAYKVNFPVYINATATTFYLYAAVKDIGNNYKVAAIFPSTFNGSTNVNETFSINIKALCDQTVDCTNFAISTTEKTYLSYFFLTSTAPTSLPIGTTIVPGSYTGGIYYEINLSNRVYSSSQIAPSISKIRPGDGRVIVEYSADASMLKPKSVRLYKFDSNPAGLSDLQPIAKAFQLAGGLTETEYPYSASGEITLNNLPNGVDTYLAVVYLDLYRFSSVVSPVSIGKPQSIEELLKKNSCFLLTAGFGEDHFVISYFRNFRDTILVNSFLGREFIGLYYETAPKYALALYKSETLRGLVRISGYILYFLFNYSIAIIFSGLLLSFFFYFFKNREKIKI